MYAVYMDLILINGYMNSSPLIILQFRMGQNELAAKLYI